MKKKTTKTEGINATVETITNVLDIIEVAAEHTTAPEVEILSEGAIMCGTGVMLHTDRDTNVAPVQIDMLDAIDALETAVKALKMEAVTLRSLVRCIADNAYDPKIGLLANAFGLRVDSNKKDREACVLNIIKHLPYYIETISDNGTIHTTPAKLTRKADNVYLAAAQTNYYDVIKDFVKNMIGNGNALLHVAVIAGKYYDSNVQLIDDQKAAKATVKAAKEEAKEAKAAKKIEDAKALLGIGNVVTLDTVGLLQEAAKRCNDTKALNHIMLAIATLAK